MLPIIPPDGRSPFDTIRGEETPRASREVSVFLDYTPLPVGTLLPVGDTVHVTVADPDDLAEWLDAAGGTVRVYPAGDDLELWVLHASTPRAGGGRVRVRVSVPVPAGAPVLTEVRQAVES